MKDYLKLLKLVKSYTLWFVFAFVCMGISSIFDGVTLGMIPTLVDRILSQKLIVAPLKLPPFLASFVDLLNTTKPEKLLSYMIIFFPFLMIVKSFFMFLQGYLMNMIAQGVVRDVKNKLYAKFQDLSLEFYANKRTGELISRITNDVSFIANALSYALTDLIYESMQIVVFACISLPLGFAISWKLFLVFLIFPLIIVPVAKIGKRIRKFSHEIQNRMADLNSLLTETIQGAYIVKMFCREDYELDRFKEINQQYYRFTMKSIKRTILLPPLTEFISMLGGISIIAIAGKQVLSGKVSSGIFFLFVASLMSMLRPFKKLANVYAINQQAVPASQRIYDILDEKPKIQESSRAKEITTLNSTVCYENIWFSYGESKEYVLEDINLEAKKGEVIALVGHSGAGKSTLVALLARLYDPQKGAIRIDGIDIKELKLQSLRSFIAIVSQEMILFNATVRDNIAYGKQKVSEEEIIDAAKKAYAYDFIDKFPKKFDTVIGDRGLKLSGGEKQRIAIARAILKNAPILVLDEATSQLDSESESLVKEAFYNLMSGKTVFVIAHRLSTVQKADKIIVMEKGRIIETGTHTELLSRHSLYKKLYDLQFNV